MIRVPLSIGNAVYTERNLKGLKIEKVADPQKPECMLLSLSLLDSNYEDIFDSLLLDIISRIIDVSDHKRVIKEFLGRIDKWQALLEKASSEGLTQEQQAGLYGELYVLRRMLATSDNVKCLAAWVGPENGIRDFQYGSWALEVKTCRGNNHQRLQISNERQLDVTTLELLFLFHLSIETQQASGETLNDMVDSVLALLQDDFSLFAQFKIKLIQAGYLAHHRVLYMSRGYIIRSQSLYEVRDQFPRIQENELRGGVGDVQYSIILSDCSSYLTNEVSAFQNLN
ncbi:putative PD-(D/E)XK family protein DUF4420 [Pontibacter mucosus]|uniref:Putative PD-(D/E)XK family protein DUF4420 n=2 Tax=Pontibacter mucosus TaxID=1649266 RepID=A0A2T5YDV4_9BACT|nr:putative PD-(D/E)XK family protein DUF4420 [Pontibacter mucosus]